jgi:asparagine synthase (glutamine-hydrolysing)
MPSIAGCYRFDGRPVEPHLIEQLLAQMAPRMAAPVALWSDGPVALGVGASAAPCVAVSGTGQWVAADARIDNRADLAAGLGCSEQSVRQMTDAELILAAYDRWGSGAPAMLVGDYAFALWDGSRRTLFCARDHFGLRPFFYHLGPDYFVFASELRGVLAWPGMSRELDEVRIGLHLAVLAPDKELTFYRAAKRLAPAHWLHVGGRDAVTSRRYWSLEATPDVSIGSPAAYAEAFRAIFTEAVRCRLPDTGPVGLLLSGGLDSTAVTAVAHRLDQESQRAARLHTFSALYERTPECDERDYVYATLKRGGLTPHFVNVEALSPLAQRDAMLAAIGEPFTAPTLYILWQLYQATQQAGLRVLLDGIDGDTAVHHGDAYLADLARAGQWAEFFGNALRLEAHGNHSVDLLVKRYAEPHLFGLARRGHWPRLYRDLRALAPYSHAGMRRLLYYYGVRPLAQRWLGQGARPPGHRPGVVNERLARAAGLHERIAAQQTAGGNGSTLAQQEHHRLLEAPLLTYVFELSSQIGRTFDIDTRHPFADRRLIEFCYALPAQFKLVDGWTRHIVRAALAGILPEAVRLRGDKAENSAAVTKALQTADGAYLARTIATGQAAELAPYVDGGALQGAFDRYRRSGSRQDEMLIWQATILAAWLRQEESGQSPRGNGAVAGTPHAREARDAERAGDRTSA